MTEHFPLSNTAPIGAEAKALSTQFKRIDMKFKPHNNGDKWMLCVRLGVPCNYRISASIESASSRSKDFLVYCTELKSVRIVGKAVMEKQR
jgi:hypothetical protein